MNRKRSEIKKEVVIVGSQPAPQAPPVEAAPEVPEIPISFETWWVQASNKHNLKPELQESVRKHFSARGFDHWKKFDAGLRDFGFRT